MACWTVFEERQALSTTFLSDGASSLSSFMAMDSAGVVTSQVARRGRVVVSPPIFSLFRVCFLAGCCWDRVSLLAADASRCKSSQFRGLLCRGAARSGSKRRVTVLPVLECAPQSWMLACHPPLEPESARSVPYLLLTLAEGEDSYLRVADFCAESIARRAESRK